VSVANRWTNRQGKDLNHASRSTSEASDRLAVGFKSLPARLQSFDLLPT
jgi:hypothetical protein